MTKAEVRESVLHFCQNRNTIIFLLVNSWMDIWMFTCMHDDQAAHLFSHLNRESIFADWG